MTCTYSEEYSRQPLKKKSHRSFNQDESVATSARKPATPYGRAAHAGRQPGRQVGRQETPVPHVFSENNKNGERTQQVAVFSNVESRIYQPNEHHNNIHIEEYDRQTIKNYRRPIKTINIYPCHKCTTAHFNTTQTGCTRR